MIILYRRLAIPYAYTTYKLYNVLGNTAGRGIRNIFFLSFLQHNTNRFIVLIVFIVPTRIGQLYNAYTRIMINA